MNDELSQHKINRGHRARQLLSDPTLNEAFESLLADADEAREQSKPDETMLREECHRAKKSIEALRKKLAFWGSDADIEQKHLDELQAKKETADVS
jgi:hypothetical protein